MPEKNPALNGGPIVGGVDNKHDKEPVCIHTRKIYDACRNKDCLEDLRVYLTRCGQAVIDRAINVKCRKAELIWVYIDVESVAFNRGFYTVDVKYFYRVTVDAFCGVGRPSEVTGLATFDKRVILFGSEGNAKIFSSHANLDGADTQLMRKANMPTAVVEAVDPICLNVKFVDRCDHHCGCGAELHEVPHGVSNYFDDELMLDDGERRLYCTLGQFSIIRLERDTQLIVPCIDFCMPEKECVGSSDDHPCNLFKRINFPVDEFFPPVAGEYTDYREAREGCCK